MSVIVNFAMFPMDKGQSLGPYVARVVDALRQCGVDYRLGPMATAFETDTVDQALAALACAHKALEEVSERIYTTVSIDARKGRTGGLTGKVESVRRNLNRL